MTILVLTTSYPSTDNDPTGRFVWRLNAGLQSCGAAVRTLALRRDPGASDRVDAAGSVAWTTDCVGFKSLDERGPSWLWQASLWRAVRELCARARAAEGAASAVLIHWLLPIPLGLGPGFGRPDRRLVVIAHGGDVDRLVRFGLLRALWRRRRPPSLIVWCVRQSDPARLAVLGLLRIVAGGGLGAPAAPPGWGAFDPAGPVLGVGRWVHGKGFDRALRALAGTGCVLQLAGAGPLHIRYERQARALGVELQLLGRLDEVQLQAAYARASAVVLPAREGRFGRAEGLPIALQEALALGRPVVASALGGLTAWHGRQGITLLDPQAKDAAWREAILAARRGPAPDPALVPTPAAVAAELYALLVGDR